MSRWWRRQWGLVLVNDQSDPPLREEFAARCWTATGAAWLRAEWMADWDPEWINDGNRLLVERLGPFDEAAYLAQEIP